MACWAAAAGLCSLPRVTCCPCATAPCMSGVRSHEQNGVAAVGTLNGAKLLAARRGLAQLPVWRGLAIVGVKVPSGVSDMPQDLDETMLGASNRACAALAATPDAAIGIGLESGLFRAGGHTFDVCCCCIRVRETQTDSFGFGSSWQMPAKVAERLDQDPSVTLNVAWEPLVSDADPTGDGLLGQLSGGVTTRSTCKCVGIARSAACPDVLCCCRRHTRIGVDGSSCDNTTLPRARCKVRRQLPQAYWCITAISHTLPRPGL